MLRQVNLPSNIRGDLFLSSMPGRYESLEQFFQEMKEQRVTRVIRLASLDEVREKSPDYYRALEKGGIAWPVEDYPVPDGGIPKDERAFLRTARDTAESLRAGERVLVHCSGGIGRTGMFAICTLIALGMSLEAAEWAVREKGSGPEKDVQRDFIRRVSSRLQS
jgi:protein-tyrosine phosphatase